MLSERSVRDLIQQARRSVDEAAAQAANARQELAGLEDSFRRQIAEARQKVVVAEVIAEERQRALALIQTLDFAEPVAKVGPARRARRSSGRSTSPEWHAKLSKLPVAPAPSLKIRAVYRALGVEGDPMGEKNTRSQLNAYKRKGIVELIDGGWRLTKPLDNEPDQPAENEGSATADASEAEAPDQAEPAGASSIHDPQPGFGDTAAA